jgi:Spy/CpxP family protein refolding chaperone
MKTLIAALLSCAFVGWFVLAPRAQPPGPRDRPPGPPRFEPGKVLPPPLRDELKLTPEQQKQIDDLEKEVRGRLLKILTDEQRKRLENHRPPGPPHGKDRPEPPPAPRESSDRGQAQDAPAGIQWFATWESGLHEAQRTGRPILLVAAAPHCSGVSGVW